MDGTEKELLIKLLDKFEKRDKEINDFQDKVWVEIQKVKGYLENNPATNEKGYIEQQRELNGRVRVLEDLLINVKGKAAGFMLAFGIASTIIVMGLKTMFKTWLNV